MIPISSTADITCPLGARIETEVCLNPESMNDLLRSYNAVCGLPYISSMYSSIQVDHNERVYQAIFHSNLEEEKKLRCKPGT